MGILWQIAGQAAARFPGKPLFIEAGGDEGEADRQLTGAAFYESVRRLAGHLRGIGIGDGSMVVLLSENCLEWPVFWFAVNAAGGIAVPLDPNLSAAELENIRRDCGAAASFLSPRQIERLFGGSAPPGIHAIGSLDGYAACPLLDPPAREGTAALIYTSGTTGVPKAVVLEERNYLANLASIQELGICGESDVFLNLLPFYHSFPFMVNVLLPVQLGASCVIMAQIKSSTVLKAMAGRGVTVLAAVPLFYRNIMAGLERKFAEAGFAGRAAARLIPLFGSLRERRGLNLGRLVFRKLHRALAPSLRYFVCGGAKLDPAVFRFFNGIGFSLIEGYGLTEAAPVVAINPPGRPRAGSAGRVIPGVDVRVIPEEGLEQGELAFRGGNVMKEYYKSPDLTAEVLDKGWLKTGDLGYVDDEGYIFITGRKKEVIVLPSGKNIYPDEIEKIFEPVAGVEECAVIPAGEGSGLSLALAVRHGEGMGEAGVAGMKEAINRLSRDLPEYRRPKRIYFTTVEFPKTSLGKPKRYKIAELFATGDGPGDRAESAAEQFGERELRILELLKAHTGFTAAFSRSLDLETELAMDSLRKIEFTVLLDEAFGRTFPEDFFADLRTVGDLLAKADRHLSGDGGGGGAARSLMELINAEPSGEEKELLLSRSRLHNRVLELLLFLFVRLLMRTFYRIDGRLNLPRSGAFIIAPDHTSFLDGPLIMAALPWAVKKRLCFVGLTDFFGRYPLKLFRVASAVISFDPLRESAKALRTAGFALKAGHPLCMFPEGARSPDGSLQELKKGVALLAAMTEAPVYPVHIGGAFEAWPMTRGLPVLFKRLTLRMGEPVRFKGHDSEEAFLRSLRDSLENLAKEVEKTRES